MENNKNMRELYKLYLELGHDVFEEKLKNLWNFIICITIMMVVMLLVCFYLISILLMTWKALSLGMTRLMNMIFLVPQLLRRKFTLMILCLLYMMITMMNMIFSVHLLLRIKFIMIMICLLNTMITMMVMIVLLSLFLIRKILLI